MPALTFEERFVLVSKRVSWNHETNFLWDSDLSTAPVSRVARAVGDRQILDGGLMTCRLRVQLHQVKNVFRHLIVDVQAQLARPFVSDRIIVSPGAVSEKLCEFGSLFR